MTNWLKKTLLLLISTLYVSGKVTFYDLGCWKDTSDRAVPSQDKYLPGSYKVRHFAIEKCAQHAWSKGHRIFAIQDGGWCASGPNARNTYWKYGPSTACGHNGKGGPWANQVYEIGKYRHYTYEYVGCYKDTKNRAIATVEGRFIKLRDKYQSRKDALKKCADIAARLEHKIFALQNGGWCATADTAEFTYDKYGPSSDCRKDGKGGPWANAVYRIKYPGEAKLTDLGCWKDTKDRAVPPQDQHLPGPYKSRINAIERCKQLAISKRYKIFAIQDGGWCATGPDAESTYQKYGMSTKCNRDGKGGPWANQVYEINRPKQKSSYSLIGCYKDSSDRAILPIEKSFLSLHDSYPGRLHAIAKCAKAAAILGNKVFAIQNGGWCATTDTAESTYNVHGPSTACKKDGEGGPWANAVYRVTYDLVSTEDDPTDLGCWKDTSDRAVPSADNKIGGPYKTRFNAIKKCATLAKANGFDVFAIQDGGWCATGPDAKKTFRKYGPSFSCKRDGKGGPWANQVYEIKAELKYRYDPVGCFKDTSDRAIPTVEKRFVVMHDKYTLRHNPIEKCAKAAAALGHKIFAVQNGGWCATSDTAQTTYNVYGSSETCKPDGEGGPWGNAVYRVTYDSPIHEIELIDLGCWKDTSDRAITPVDNHIGGPYKTRYDAIQKCAAYAKSKGYTVFGVQDGGWCATGPDAKKTFNKYGPSFDCKRDGKGGPWANQVYMLKVVLKYTYDHVGCFKDTSDRAIPTVEKRFVKLHESYTLRADAVEKCAEAAASLGYQMFAVQNGGWCATSDTAQTTYDVYGPSTTCAKDGEGGPWGNDVYKVTYDPPIEQIELTDLGCWKDTKDRAIPSQDGYIGGPYKSRLHAIQKCAAYAMDKGFDVFAIQDGGWCATGPDAKQTFYKYGPSFDCKRDGKGGPWANQVYKIGSKPEHSFEYLGCFKDTADRAISTVEKRFVNLHDAYAIRVNSVKKCAEAAAALGYKTFAVQNGGWCATSDTAETTYNLYGSSSSCLKGGEGGPWGNAVYRVKYETPMHQFSLVDLGCWKDTKDRAIPPADSHIGGPYKTRLHAIQRCAAYAKKNGFNVFAIQDGGWCATGAHARQTFHQYGPSFDCKRDGKGGPWANQVYEIKSGIQYFYHPVGCFKDSSDRAIPTVEKRFVTLHGRYSERSNAVEKCAEAAASLGYKMFSVQNGGWCATSDTAHNTYNKHGPSDKCKAGGEGGPWANAVYRIFRKF